MVTTKIKRKKKRERERKQEGRRKLEEIEEKRKKIMRNDSLLHFH